MSLLLVALGGAVGALVRYLVDRAVVARFDPVLPWGTLTVNVAGSALLGGLAGAGAAVPDPGRGRVLRRAHHLVDVRVRDGAARHLGGTRLRRAQRGVDAGGRLGRSRVGLGRGELNAAGAAGRSGTR